MPPPSRLSTTAQLLGLANGHAPTLRELILVVSLVVLLLNLTAPADPRVSVTDAQPASSSTRSLSNQTNSLSTWNRHFISPRIDWGSGSVPETAVTASVPGWTMFDRLYVLNGTLYIVSNGPRESLPEFRHIMSKGHWIQSDEEHVRARLPSDKEIQIISTDTAKRLFGTGADRIDGMTWLVNDPPQFITHYYHWAAELTFGFWRTHSSLDPYITADGKTTVAPPRRMSFIRGDADHWRDYAAMNQWITRSAFPSMTMEFNDDWEDRKRAGRVEMYDRVIIADRSAAITGYNFLRTARTAAAAAVLPGSIHWFSPVRNAVIDFANARLSTPLEDRPVITYVSRQEWGRRMLIQKDHEKLVEELHKLRDTYGWEVNVVSMDKLSRLEQLQLAGRTTIMMGVHGNGLTSLIWMKPGPRTTVMEFFFPGGFAMDYEWTARSLGMVHYGFHGNEAFTRPNSRPPQYVEGFQGNNIPLDGALVARICVERLTLSEELDEA